MAKKVLVVDDEKLIVKGIRYSLEQDLSLIHILYTSMIPMAKSIWILPRVLRSMPLDITWKNIKRL